MSKNDYWFVWWFIIWMTFVQVNHLVKLNQIKKDLQKLKEKLGVKEGE